MEEREINGLVISKTVTVDYVGQTENGKSQMVGAKPIFTMGLCMMVNGKTGKCTARLKEFYPDGTLQFEGYYKDGYQNGRGKSLLQTAGKL